MAHQRIPIPDEIAAAVLVAADRTCCVCNSRGRPVQIHHIDGDAANNELTNLAILCLECHNATLLRGGFGRHLTAAQVFKYRDNWNARVELRRAEADKLASQLPAVPPPSTAREARSDPPPLPSRSALLAFIRTLPSLRRLAYAAARPGWDSGVTAEIMEASYRVIEVLEVALVGLARFYPYEHFGAEDPREYFSELIATRFRWHRYHHSTAGEAWSGTIVGPLAANEVIADVEAMLEEMVGSLALDLDRREFEYQAWQEDWRSAHVES